MNKTLVEPGTPLAYSEELLPGTGTYDDGEQIRAAVYGQERVDPETMTIHVDGAEVPAVEKGDIILGEITFLKDDLASVKILQVKGKGDRNFQAASDGTLRVRSVDKRFVRAMQDEFKCGDLIRAEVTGLKGGPQLATDKPHLGVIRAVSRRNSSRLLELQGRKLIDPETGHQETRKIADDYGSGQL
ncbi:MAG: exosome complex RNA-binding protein Csl4 [Thermoplasmatota archaeon]